MPRVLLVEDDPVQARAIAGHLRHRLRGVAVDVEHDGLVALGMLRLIRYDLVIADVSVPSLQGHELSLALRQILGDRPRVVLLSGRTPDALSDLAERHGANAWLEKPISAEALVTLSARLLGVDPSD